VFDEKCKVFGCIWFSIDMLLLWKQKIEEDAKKHFFDDRKG
jgi:hypothetical protein